MFLYAEHFIHLAESLVCPEKPTVEIFLALNLITVISFKRSDNVCEMSGFDNKEIITSWKETRQALSM